MEFESFSYKIKRKLNKIVFIETKVNSRKILLTTLVATKEKRSLNSK